MKVEFNILTFLIVYFGASWIWNYYDQFEFIFPDPWSWYHGIIGFVYLPWQTPVIIAVSIVAAGGCNYLINQNRKRNQIK